MTRHTCFLFGLPLLFAAGACGAKTVVGPGDGNGGNPAPADVVHNVTVRLDSLTVMGSCDRNSIFESPNDGEFLIGVAVRMGTSNSMNSMSAALINLDGTYTERVHVLGSNARASFTRNITKGERFAVVLTVTERDGLLGNDPAMNNRSGQRIYEYRSNAWSSDAGVRMIELDSGNPAQCGIRLRFTISTVAAG